MHPGHLAWGSRVSETHVPRGSWLPREFLCVELKTLWQLGMRLCFSVVENGKGLEGMAVGRQLERGNVMTSILRHTTRNFATAKINAKRGHRDMRRKVY